MYYSNKISNYVYILYINTALKFKLSLKYIRNKDKYIFYKALAFKGGIAI